MQLHHIIPTLLQAPVYSTHVLQLQHIMQQLSLLSTLSQKMLHPVPSLTAVLGVLWDLSRWH